ncbi:MAG TPA: TVP38/TMEM64 family protein [Planctomycetaceae bacterium]|nr:TVP38/TMEM64 family protein [Planctomycetaceae bacterium]
MQNEKCKVGRTAGWGRIAAGVMLVAVVIAAYLQFRERLTLQALAQSEAQFRQFQFEHPWLIYGVLFAAYVLVTGLSLPGATGMTLLTSWLLGFWPGLVVVSFASTTGASLAFLLSRYLLRDAIQSRFGERLARFNEALGREGAFYLFTLRLIPAVPFFVINVVMGLTPLRLWTFWWVSQLGMLPGTVVYVYAGSRVPSLEVLAQEGVRGIISTELIVALALLGLFPLAVRWFVSLYQKRKISRRGAEGGKGAEKMEN